MKRLFAILILLAVLGVPALAQAVTVRGAYNTACCTNAQLLWFENRNFLFGVNPDNPRGAYQIFALGAAGQFETIQINYVDTFRLWATTRNHAFRIVAFRIVGNGIDQTLPITTGDPIAAPSLLVEGVFAPLGGESARFSNGIFFPARSDTGSVTLFGAGFGAVTDWTVTVEGLSDDGEFISFDFPARAFPLGQPYGHPHLVFTLSGQPPGNYSFVARGGGFQTNAVVIRIARN